MMRLLASVQMPAAPQLILVLVSFLKFDNSFHDNLFIFFPDQSYTSSNEYYVEVEYNCYDLIGAEMFCSYASSELFSIIVIPSSDQLQVHPFIIYFCK